MEHTYEDKTVDVKLTLEEVISTITHRHELSIKTRMIARLLDSLPKFEAFDIEKAEKVFLHMYNDNERLRVLQIIKDLEDGDDLLKKIFYDACSLGVRFEAGRILIEHGVLAKSDAIPLEKLSTSEDCITSLIILAHYPGTLKRAVQTFKYYYYSEGGYRNNLLLLTNHVDIKLLNVDDVSFLVGNPTWAYLDLVQLVGEKSIPKVISLLSKDTSISKECSERIIRFLLENFRDNLTAKQKSQLGKIALEII